MGVNGFNNFFSECYEEKHIENYNGKLLVIDAIYQIYKYVIGIRSSGNDMVDNEGNFASHKYAIITFTYYLLINGIKPLYVFDTTTPKIKNNELKNRNKIKNDAIKNMNKNDKNYIKNFKKSYSITAKQINECKEILDIMGIPYTESLMEADPQCAALTYIPEVYGIIGNDTDLLVFGGKKLLCDFGKNGGKIREITLENVLLFMLKRANIIRMENKLELFNSINHNNLINFCVMLGTDYSSRIHESCDTIFIKFVLNDFNLDKTVIGFGKNVNEYKNAILYYTLSDVIHPDCINKTFTGLDMKRINKLNIPNINLNKIISVMSV